MIKNYIDQKLRKIILKIGKLFSINKRNKIKDKNYKQIFIFNFIKIYIIFNLKYFRKIEYFLIYIKIN